jgi:hypothetical protein
MKLSKLDHVFLVLPVLGVFDVLSTFFAAWQGYPIQMYETGLFASYFAQKNLLHLYIFLYLGILSGMAAIFLFIKREVSEDRFFDKLLLLLLVGAIYLIEAVLTNVIVSNFLLGLGIHAPLGGLRWLIYLSVFLIILVYVWDELKELFGVDVYGGN